MIYFINGEEKYLINQKINEIIKKHPNHKISHFNSETNLNETLNEISTFSLFDNQRILIFNDFYLLNKNEEKEIKNLVNAFNFIPEGTIIIFVLEKQVDKIKNLLITYLKVNATNFSFPLMNEKEILQYVKKMVDEKGIKISDVNLYYLLSKIPHKLIFIANEIDKFAGYNKPISKEVIDDLVTKYHVSGAFDFINAFHEQDVESIFKIYYEKTHQGETIISLISQISYALELCSQIYSYKEMDYSNEKISNLLKKHIFVIKKNFDLLKIISYSKLQKYLKELAELDLKIKENKIDEKIGFESFLLNVIRDK